MQRIGMVRPLAAALAFVAVLTACARGSSTGASPKQTPPQGGCALQHYVANDQVVCLDGRSPVSLGKDIRSPIAGYQSPAGVPGRGGRYVLYNVWHSKVEGDARCLEPDPSACPRTEPDAIIGEASIWRADLAGCDMYARRSSACADLTLFEDGATSVAWRSDGTVAYFKGIGPGVPGRIRMYNGHVLSRVVNPDSGETVPGEPLQWTTKAGHYVVVAFAGARLIAYRAHLGDEGMDVLIFDAPGVVRELKDVFISAISPDGSKLVVTHTPDPGADHRLRVIDIATGDTLQELQLLETRLPGSDEVVDDVSGHGAWRRDAVATATEHGILLWRWEGSKLQPHRLLRTGLESKMFGISHPSLSDDASEVGAWVAVPKRDVSYADERKLNKQRQDVLVVTVRCTVATAKCEKVGRSLSIDSFMVAANWSVG